MRVKGDGLHVTVPPFTKTSQVLDAIGPFRTRLLEQFRKNAVKPLDGNFSLVADCFRLRMEASPLAHFTIREGDDGICLYYPQHADFSDPGIQKLARNAIVRAMKRSAAAFLPPLLQEWANRYGLSYRKVRITGARSRWGSCSAAGTISLSCYLMLLPPHLMDYVILHELAHTREMNHGPRFWALLDGMAEGQALRLRAELKRFSPSF